MKMCKVEMRISIFGASGKTGRLLVDQALAAGHEVTALVRTPSKLDTQHPNLTLIEGDIQDTERVKQAISGVDVVISVLGPSSNKPEFAISRGMDNILTAMRSSNVRRLIISAGAGVRDPQDKPKPVDRFFGLLLGLLSKNVVADMRQTVEKVRASDRDWTIVRVPMLTDQPATGQYIVGYVGDIRPRLSRADMASFLLKQVNDSTYLRKAPAISN